MASQPTITPGSNGYMSMLPQQNYQNPWTGVASNDAAAVPGMVDASQGQINQLQNQSQNFQPSSYPTFPNSAGLGTQNAYQQQAPAPQQPQIPDASARGANPWSFSGEANSR